METNSLICDQHFTVGPEPPLCVWTWICCSTGEQTIQSKRFIFLSAFTPRPKLPLCAWTWTCCSTGALIGKTKIVMVLCLAWFLLAHASMQLSTPLLTGCMVAYAAMNAPLYTGCFGPPLTCVISTLHCCLLQACCWLPSRLAWRA
jgi:hypothetical protein